MKPNEQRFLRGVYTKVDRMERRHRQLIGIVACVLGLAVLSGSSVLCAVYRIRVDIVLLGLLGAMALLLVCALDWLRLQIE